MRREAHKVVVADLRLTATVLRAVAVVAKTKTKAKMPNSRV
jgi:hypothetical protein